MQKRNVYGILRNRFPEHYMKVRSDMEQKQSLPLKSKISYALGAVGKDMVYMLSASYVLYYFQDLLGVNAIAMGIILMAARVFDAFNDPIMGVIVAKTRTRWG